MKGWFERLTVHGKLVVSALLISTVALAVQMLGLAAFDLWRFRAAAGDDASSLASVLAENTAAAVVFNQPDAAEETLQSVRVRGVVTRTCIYLASGELFAAFPSTPRLCPASIPTEGPWSLVSGTAPVTRNGRTYGTVYVERNLSALQSRMLLNGLVGFAMLLFAASAAYLTSLRVTTGISTPIKELARFARRFGETTDAQTPSIRVTPDELGELVTAFGDMVTRVRSSNDQLIRSNEALLHEKAERDAALEREVQTERRFKMLANGSPVLLWVNGPDGCEFVNRAYLDFIGLSGDQEVMGFDWSRFVHPDDRDAYLNAYLSSFASRSQFAAEFRFLRRDGEWRWMRSEATPRIESDAFLGFVGASVDITERKRAEDALLATDQRKDAFLAILAHELRNPLAPIRTGLELLRVGGAQPDVVNHVRPILERQVTHMVRLIDDLLDVSRITSGKIQLQRRPTALQDLVTAATEANRAAMESAGLTVTVTVPDSPCILDVDPTRFVQVLSNLLHNAIKFTPRGGRIAVAAAMNDDASQLSLAVTDSGEGIARSLLPHVFDFFVQGESGRRAKSGLGIGLGLAKQLVELHGGTIRADSPGPELGSSFTISMPVMVPAADDAPADAALSDGPKLECRVLVVDDNVDAADTLATFIGALGGETRTTYSGTEALRLIAEFHPDVILLDIGMPEMDGYDTCRRLRALPAGQTAYVVALTGFGQPHDRERALSGGFDAHLTKPVDPGVLRNVLTAAPVRRVGSGSGH